MVGTIDKKYIYKHIMKAERILKEISFPNKECKFVDIDDLEFEYTENDQNLASYNKNKLYVNKKKCLKNKCESRYDNKFISILQHELIHYYCDINLNHYKLLTGNDSSPIFHSIIIFFNARGLEIKSNGKLDETYKKYQTNLANTATNLKVNFNELVENLNYWEEKLYKEIETYNELYKKSNPSKKVLGHFRNNEDSKSTYNIIENGDFKAILFDIEFGINLVLERDGKNSIKDFLMLYTDLDSGLTTLES